MCGISGIVKWNEQVDRSEIEKMNASIAHRGPDATGVYLEQNVGFGHQRLSILDLSADGNQPMFFNELVMVYNGEIYNYIEIREELKKLGRSFKTKTDSEVILHAYEEWGAQCVNKFNGMWAFAIHDKKKQEVFISRDRFGIKPLYYRADEKGISFGSEIKQLLTESSGFNEDVLMNYLVLGYDIYDDDTFFKGVKSLSPSRNITIDLKEKKFSIDRYYTIAINHDLRSISEAEALEIYSESFKRSVELRLRSDVKVGTCLSGGLDSSFVAAMAASMFDGGDQKFQAINAGVKDEKINESHFAEIVANASDIELHKIFPTAEDFHEAIDEVIYTQEEPFLGTSQYMQYFVLEKAKELGCTVMLDGQAGDEILLGYPKYYASYLGSLPMMKKFRAVMSSARNSGIPAMRIMKMWAFFTNGKLRYKTLQKRWSIVDDSWLNKASKQIILDLSKAYHNIDDLQKMELELTQLPRLLKYEDKNAMRHSIETRLPFTDYNHVELSLSLPQELKIKNGWTKYIQRKAMEPMLPDEIVWRKNKLGFVSPHEHWVGSYQKEMVEFTKNSDLVKSFIKDINSIDSLDPQHLWKLFNIAKWADIYKVS